jgi:hypothetical protein
MYFVSVVAFVWFFGEVRVRVIGIFIENIGISVGISVGIILIRVGLF